MRIPKIALVLGLIFYGSLLVAKIDPDFSPWLTWLLLVPCAKKVLTLCGELSWLFPVVGFVIYYFFPRSRTQEEILYWSLGLFCWGFVLLDLLAPWGGTFGQWEKEWMNQRFSNWGHFFFIVFLAVIGYFLLSPAPTHTEATRRIPLLNRTLFPSKYLLPPLAHIPQALPKESHPPIQTKSSLQKALKELELPWEALEEEGELDGQKRFSIPVSKEEGTRFLTFTETLSLSTPGLRIFYPIPEQPDFVRIQIPFLQEEARTYSELVTEKNPIPSSGFFWVLGEEFSSGERILIDLNTPILIAGSSNIEQKRLLSGLLFSLLMQKNPIQAKILLGDLAENLDLDAQTPHFLGPILQTREKVIEGVKWLHRQDTFFEHNSEEKWILIINGFEQVPEILPLLRDILQRPNRPILPILFIYNPSPKIISSELKAEYPQRICLRVNSAFDSRTVLERNGAEELKGQGDFYLFRKMQQETVHGQSIEISPQEMHFVQNYWIRQGTAYWNPDLATIDAKAEDKVDPYLEKAVRLVLSSQRVSVPHLKNRLQIEESHAQALLEMMEREKIIQRSGTQAQILMTLKDWEENR